MKQEYLPEPGLYRQHKRGNTLRFFRELLLLSTLLLCSWVAGAQSSRTVSGQVTGENGDPLIGVTILVKGSLTGTITDVDGNYSLDLPNDADILTVSYVGYLTQEVEIGTQTRLDITMEQDAVGLDEVVVIGYGTVKKKDLTGAVTSIDAEKLETTATSNMTDMLRANAPGLNVNFNASAKGISSASDLEIRGSTNLRGAGPNAPLIVLDGMLYSGDLADINPNDIASFDILKDASSAAIYGSRASNGVIIITTKKGKTGKPTINVSSSVGVAKLSHARLEPMTGPQFIDWRIAGYESNERKQVDFPNYYDNPDNLPSGISIEDWKSYDGSSASSDLVGIWLNRIGFSPVEIANYKAGNTIDWTDHEFQNGLRNDHNISISGRTDNMSYYWSLGYVGNEGYVLNEKFSAVRSRLNLEATIAPWLKVGTNTQLALRDESPIPSSTNLTNVTAYSSFYEEDGTTITYAPTGNISASRHPWLELVYRERSRDITTLSSLLYATVELPLGFSFTHQFIPQLDYSTEFNHWSSEHPEWGNQGGIASRSHYQNYEWQINNILKWNRDFGKHTFDLTLLQNAEKFQDWYDIVRRSQYQPSDVLGYSNIGGATNDVEIRSNDEYETADALMARLNYSFNDRYMFTVSYRRDGYSAFGQKHPHANFGSAALGWIISEESFFNVSWLELLKLRFSYGTNGNRSIGRYSALSDLATGRYVLVIDGQPQYVSQLYANRLANSDLKWERTGAYNFGIDFSTNQGKINGNVEVYYMKTEDLLVQRTLPNVTGYFDVFTNLGQVDNRGFEISLNTVNVDNPSFSWRSNFILTHNTNKIVHLYGDLVDVEDENGNVIGQKEADDVTNGWFIGHGIDQIWDYEVLGIWQSNEEDEAARYSREPGDFKLRDVNNDGVYTNDDKVFQGYTKPRYRVTLGNDLQVKNWNLSVKLYSYLGHFAANNHKKNNDVFYDRGASFDVPYWTPENPNDEWARVESYETGYTVFENSSFIRLDNVALSYDVPVGFLQRYGLSRLRLSAIAQNPYVWAPTWSWMDPENRGYTPTYYTFKVNLTL